MDFPFQLTEYFTTELKKGQANEYYRKASFYSFYDETSLEVRIFLKVCII